MAPSLSSGPSRDPAAAATVLLTAAVVIVGLSAHQVAPAAAQASMTADDVVISNGDGGVDSLFYQPSFTLSWQNLAATPANVTIEYYSEINGTADLQGVATYGIDPGNQSLTGSEDIDSTQWSLVGGLDWDRSTFNDTTEDGTPKNTTVTLYMNAEFQDANGNSIGNFSRVGETSFVVSVNNETTTVSATGEFGTGGSG